MEKKGPSRQIGVIHVRNFQAQMAYNIVSSPAKIYILRQFHVFFPKGIRISSKSVCGYGTISIILNVSSKEHWWLRRLPWTLHPPDRKSLVISVLIYQYYSTESCCWQNLSLLVSLDFGLLTPTLGHVFQVEKLLQCVNINGFQHTVLSDYFTTLRMKYERSMLYTYPYNIFFSPSYWERFQIGNIN